jgi:hypothetical protein
MIKSINNYNLRIIKVLAMFFSLAPIQSDASPPIEKQVPMTLLQVPSGAYLEEIIKRLNQQQEVIKLQTKYIEMLDTKVTILEGKVTELENK